MLRIVTNHIIFFIALLYIYIFFFTRDATYPITRIRSTKWWTGYLRGKKKKRKELIQPDPVINRRDLK